MGEIRLFVILATPARELLAKRGLIIRMGSIFFFFFVTRGIGLLKRHLFWNRDI